jgi:hypothetical protein
MAARNRISPQQEERVRAAIRSTCLAKRLQMFALSEVDPQSGKVVEMSQAQVHAAMGLLRKTTPDLSNVEMSGEGGGPLVVEIVRFGGAKE